MAGELYFVAPSDAEIRVGEEVLTQGQLVARLCADVSSPIAQRICRSKIRKASWKDISGEGYTSSIYRIVLELDENDEITFIFKSFSFPKLKHFAREFIGISISQLPPEKLATLTGKLSVVHDSECTFYKLFASRNCAVAGVSLPLADIYDIEPVTLDAENVPTGFILMEDLTADACTINIAEGLSEDQVRQVVDVLADFHAALLCDQNEMAPWRNEITKAQMMSEDSIEHMESFAKKFETGCDKSALVPSVQRLKKAMNSKFYLLSNVEIVQQLGLPYLVVHGDMWSNNVLWKRVFPGGPAGSELCALIDWQLCHRGNQMMDFARLLVTSCEADVRHRVEDWLIPYYHARVQQKLQKHGVAVDLPTKNLKLVYDYSMVAQATFNLFTVEPMHRAFKSKSNDVQLVADQTRCIINRALAALQDAEVFLAANAPEWLSDPTDTKDLPPASGQPNGTASL